MAGQGKRGPQRKLDRPRLERILGHIRDGHGRYMACQLESVSYVTLRKRFKEDPSILEEIVMIERSRVEDCLKVAYDLRTHADPMVRIKAITVYLSQMLKMQEARRAVAARNQPKADGERLAGLMREAADTLYDLVPEEKRDEMIRRMEELERRVEAA